MAVQQGAEKRGPKLGDSASLWNFTPSPGWTKEQANILRLCLMKYGVGRWVQILDTGLLPGKLIQQLNGQTQRLLGQQSLAAYTGLQVDIDRIRTDNELKTQAERKGGLIIWSGPNPTKKMKDEWRVEGQAKYGLTKEQIDEAELALEELAAAQKMETAGSSQLSLVNLMEEPLEGMVREQKVLLLRRLQRKLQSLALSLQVPPAAIGATETAEEGPKQLPADQPQPAAAKAQKAEQKKGGRAPKKPTPKPVIKTAEERVGSKRSRGAKSKSDAEGGAGGAVPAEALEANLGQLQAMGFSRPKALEALEESENDVEAAIAWLVSNCI